MRAHDYRSNVTVGLVGMLLAVCDCRCGGARPIELPPPSPSVLSLLHANGTKCAWVRFDPVTNDRRTLAELDVPCLGGVVTWSHTTTRALIWFDYAKVTSSTFAAHGIPVGFVKPEITPPAGLAPRIFVVDLAAPTPLSLPLPPAGTLERLAFDDQDRVVALTEAPAHVGADGETVLVDGVAMKVDKEREGLPLAVRAFLWEKGGWHLIETRLSDTGWDYAQGVGALAVTKSLSVTSREELTPHAKGAVVEDEALLRKLNAFAPKDAHGDAEWRALAAPAKAYVWHVSIEVLWATGLVVFADGDELVAPPGLGFTAGDLAAHQVSDRFLLVAASETGSHPRLYDLETRTLLYASDADRAAVFWPTTKSAE